MYFLSGLCTEFNVDGGVIQIHSTSPCGKDKFPNCSETYKSSEAYKCMTAHLLNFILFVQSLYVDLFLNDFFFFYVQYYQSIHVADFHWKKNSFSLLILSNGIDFAIFLNQILLMVIYKKIYFRSGLLWACLQ